MKKSVEKPKAKTATKPAKADVPRKAEQKVIASTHDPMHNLLRGAHASKICR